MKVRSWPKSYENEKELLNGLIGAISEHLTTYKAKVLHRDVSPGNMLFVANLTDKDLASHVSDTRGVLIDLDHAKSTDRVKTVSTPVTPEIVKDAANYLRHRNIGVSNGAIAQAMKLCPDDIAVYCRQAKALNVLDAKPKGDWTAEDFGWNDVGEVPVFGSHNLDVAQRTWTRPYISHQLLSLSAKVHDAIHDMESFWWALVYICLTRESGGAQHREDDNIERKRLVAKLFYATEPELCRQKYHFFNPGGKELVKSSLLKHVYKYFEELKPLVQKWRDVLYLGYRFNAYECYHTYRYFLAVAHNIYDQLPNEDSTTPRPAM